VKSVNRRVGRPSKLKVTDRIILNVPHELAEQLRDLAERERRPLGTQVQVLVERALADMQSADIAAA
jgi:predicted DNA-binding protein